MEDTSSPKNRIDRVVLLRCPLPFWMARFTGERRRELTPSMHHVVPYFWFAVGPFHGLKMPPPGERREPPIVSAGPKQKGQRPTVSDSLLQAWSASSSHRGFGGDNWQVLSSRHGKANFLIWPLCPVVVVVVVVAKAGAKRHICRLLINNPHLES